MLTTLTIEILLTNNVVLVSLTYQNKPMLDIMTFGTITLRKYLEMTMKF